jgi:hypothetical protein
LGKLRGEYPRPSRLHYIRRLTVPTYQDRIDLKAADEFMGWWNSLPRYKRIQIARKMRGFWRWVGEVYALTLIRGYEPEPEKED